MTGDCCSVCLWSAADRVKCSSVSKCVAGIVPHMSHFLLFLLSDGPRFSHEHVPAHGLVPCSQMYSDASNQQTIKTGENAKEFGLNILNTLRSFWMVFHSPDVLSGSSFPLSVCLLIEILIEISEGDFNHRGVVHAYLSEPQRKKDFAAAAVTPASVREKCALRHVSHSGCVTLAKLQQT